MKLIRKLRRTFATPGELEVYEKVYDPIIADLAVAREAAAARAALPPPPPPPPPGALLIDEDEESDEDLIKIDGKLKRGNLGLSLLAKPKLAQPTSRTNLR